MGVTAVVGCVAAIGTPPAAAFTDRARNQLYNHQREVLGDEDAAAMMGLLPPVGWSDLARQRDPSTTPC